MEIIDPYLAPKVVGMKENYVDVRARDEQGRNCIIKMQVLNVKGFEKRVLYNACKSYSSQVVEGQSYRLLADVIAVTLTDFVMFKEAPGVVNSFKLRGEEGGLYIDDLQLIFAELPKFNKDETPLSRVLDRWFYFLRHASDLKAVPKTLDTEPALRHALKIANRAGLSQEELDIQEKREMFIRDQRAALTLAWSQGQEQGLKQGREEGREQGEQTARLNIARQLPAAMDDAGMAAATGLGIDVIRQLRR